MASNRANRAHLWKLRGKIYLWRYLENERNYPDWHLSLDREAFESLNDFFRILDEDQIRSFRTLAITRPTPAVLAVPSNRGGKARYKSPTKLRVSFDPESETDWELSESGDPLEWNLGTAGLSQVVSFFSEPHPYFDSSFGGSRSIWWWGIAAE